jgi:hypothetical protein
MTKTRIIGAALFSLLLAGPALSAGSGYRTNHASDEYNGRVIHKQDAGTASPAHHRWPSNENDSGAADENFRLPPSAHGG